VTYAPEYFGGGGPVPGGIGQVGPPVLSNGRLHTLIIGDDYKAANGRALVWVIATTVTVESCHLVIFQNNTRKMVIEGTPTNGSGEATLSFDIDGDDWEPMRNGDAEFNVEMRDAAGNEITPIHSFVQRQRVLLVRKFT